MRIYALKNKMVITREQTKDFGMIMILIMIFIGIYLNKYIYIKIAFGLTLIAIFLPVLFYPFAFCWFGLSRLLGTASTSILLSIIFIIIVIPVGLIRRITGHDNLKMKQFRRNKKSVMNPRNHIFDSSDLLHPF